MLTSPGMENRLKLLALNPVLYLGKPSYLLNLKDCFLKLSWLFGEVPNGAD